MKIRLKKKERNALLAYGGRKWKWECGKKSDKKGKRKRRKLRRETMEKEKRK